MARVSTPRTPRDDVTSIGDLFSFSWHSSRYAVIADNEAPSQTDILRQQSSQRKALLPFVIISLSYMIYTFTDGAVRMIVLLAAYNKGFTAMEVAVMFTLYETAGVVTNLLAGLAGAKWGLKTTHCSGLVLQLVGLGMLCGWKVAHLRIVSRWRARSLSLPGFPFLPLSLSLPPPLPPSRACARALSPSFSHARPLTPCVLQDSWEKTTSIVYMTLAQMLCGIAKDLVKLGGKAVTKLVTPDERQGMLFSLVSYVTGFKNSMKGVGYLAGALMVGTFPAGTNS